MGFLILASLLFAASFGLISRHLSGVDPSFVAFARLAIATALFLPFYRAHAVQRSLRARLIAIGAVQFGLMYVLYQQSYGMLLGHEIALFTTLTPLHVALLDGALRRKLDLRCLLAACIAVGAALVLAWVRPDRSSFGTGFLLVQAANLCFAFGQVFYARLIAAGAPHHRTFALPYLGGLLVAGLAFAFGSARLPSLEPSQWAVLVYLGLVPAGIGFYLWNVGATRVSSGVLAAANNLKAPLGVALAIGLFHEQADPVRLTISSALILLALIVARQKARAPA